MNITMSVNANMGVDMDFDMDYYGVFKTTHIIEYV